MIFTILSYPLSLSAQGRDNIHYFFTQSDSNYTFYGSFKLIADPACLLNISFDYKHIKALAVDAKEILLISRGDTWNRISYTYLELPFYKNVSSWHRVLDAEKQRIDFTLIKSINNTELMPQMISSSGYYKINQEGEYVTVEYYQQSKLTKKFITKLYMNSAKKEAIKFLKQFYDYSMEHCQ